MATLVGSISGPEFGIAAETAIILENIEETAPTETVNFEGTEGSVDMQAIIDLPRELTADYRVKVPASMPAETLRGHVLTFGDARFSGNYIVKEVNKSKSIKGWLSGSLSATLDSTWTTTT